jgi:UDP-N-acetyl-D-mannosaminuronate dehydrogenase
VTALGALGSRLEERLTTHAATVGMAGLGYVGAYDLMLLLTAHAEFEPKRLVSDARLVVDTRYATGALGEFPHVVRL